MRPAWPGTVTLTPTTPADRNGSINGVDFKRSGKYVYAWLEYGGDREYYLASVADKVYLLPSASLDLTGVASYEVFLRGAADKVLKKPA